MPGGRILEYTYDGDKKIEVGATFIDAECPNIERMAKKFGLSL